MAFAKSLATKYPSFARLRTILSWIVLGYLRFFATLTLVIHKPTTIGIAGSVGKSTTRDMLTAILTHKKTLVVSGNSETGIPLGLLRLQPGSYTLLDWIRILVLAPTRLLSTTGYTYLIVEMGIDGPHPPKNMEYLLTIIKPDIAILLNETPAHFKNYDSILPDQKNLNPGQVRDHILTYMTRDDGKIITHSGARIAIYNADDPYIPTYITPIHDQAALTFGKAKSNTISYGKHVISPDGTAYSFLHDDKEITITMKDTMLPLQVQSLFAAALATAEALYIPLEDAASSIEKHFRLPAGRGQTFDGIHHSRIIDSSYNASPASMYSFIELAIHRHSPRILILGDMLELGSTTSEEHVRLAKKLPKIFDNVYCTGPLCKQFILPILKKHKDLHVRWFENSVSLGSFLQENLPKNAFIFVKGAGQLEEAIKLLLKTRSDRKRLCRQDTFWEMTKKTRGVWVS